MPSILRQPYLPGEEITEAQKALILNKLPSYFREGTKERTNLIQVGPL